jgi:hypothetical protein
MRGRGRGRVADWFGATVECGGCAMQSTAPAAHRGSPSCVKVSLARGLSPMRVRARLSGWCGQGLHVVALAHAGSWAVRLIEGS